MTLDKHGAESNCTLRTWKDTATERRLEEEICEVLSDGRGYSAKWICNMLRQRGVEASVYSVATALKRMPGIEREPHAGRLEYRLVGP